LDDAFKPTPDGWVYLCEEHMRLYASSDTPKPRNPLIAYWKPEDVKLLVVSVVATVIANIVTAFMVAGAILSARYAFRGIPVKQLGWQWAIIGGMAFILYAAMRNKRRSDSKLRRVMNRISWVAMTLVALNVVVLILGFIGYALGVK
jgi:hypothetical protein